MSLTGRPSRPPLALTSSSQIFIATSDILPLGASGPVSAMPKPIVIGWPDGAWAAAATVEAASAALASNEAARTRHFSAAGMVSSVGRTTADGTTVFPLPSSVACRLSSVVCRPSSPHLVGEGDDHAQLRPLLVLGEDIAFLGRGEAALGREAELLERRELGRLLDPALDVVLLLERAALGGDEAEHHDLVALGQVAQRLEAAGALAVVFEEIAVVVAAPEQVLGDRLVAAGGNPGRAEIAAADMGGDGHVGGLPCERLVDGAGIGLLQVIDVEPAVLRLLELLLRAEIGPGGVVELQIAAAGVVEGAHGLLVSRAEIVEDGVAVGIGGLRDRARLEAEVHHARARDRHLGHDPGVGLQKPEMLQHRVIGKADPAADANALGLGLHALELDAVIELVDFDAVEQAEEIEVPPGAAKLAVGRELQPHLLLLPDDLLDLPVLDLLERGGADRPLLVLGARLLERRRAQEAADVIGPERRPGSFHRWAPRNSLPRARPRLPRRRQPQNDGELSPPMWDRSHRGPV